MPLFEAVQNSIHAIEETGNRSGRITVDVVRDKQSSLPIESRESKRGPESHPNIIGFRISDNGIGFNDTHMRSFETLDTDLKASLGGRGIGRLLWLKAFDGARIDSTYFDGGGSKQLRSFDFTAKNGIVAATPKTLKIKGRSGATVYLHGFNPQYRDSSRKTVEAIAAQLFEHCLWYFVREGAAPTIIVRDEETSINLDSVYESHMHSSAKKDSIEIKGRSFELTHIKLKVSSYHTHRIGWCASNRLVKEENIAGKIPGLHGRLGEGDDQFIYACYVSSEYLNERVRPERTDFVLEKGDPKGLFAKTEITENELTDAVLACASDFLAPYLESKRQAGLNRVEKFVAQIQPRYRPIIDRIPEEELYVDPTISDKELDVYLHRHRSEVERRLLSDGHDLMEPKEGDQHGDYAEQLKEYLKLADDVKKSDLAEYVFHRKVILDLLRMAIKRLPDGTYNKEDLLHDLIMPMRTDSNSVEFDRNNLWLIDERLTFHDFLASDKTLASLPITGSSERKEPDIIALSVYDEPVLLAEGREPPFASLVVVELKRPMRKEAAPGEENDPIEQCLGYLKRIRDGRVMTASGRPIPNSANIPGFCYIICDLTKKVIERCEFLDLTVTSDKMGYFGYHSTRDAYIEVISYDRLLQGATERNRAFFDRLGLPNN